MNEDTDAAYTALEEIADFYITMELRLSFGPGELE